MTPRNLRLLVMHVSTKCDQACAHCTIWRRNGLSGVELGVEERLSIIRQAASLGAREILFTGGEPLLCDHIESLARAAKSVGLAVKIASNGLGLSRSTPWLSGVVDEVYVSLDGPEEIHDSIRGVFMFSRLKASVGAVLALAGRPRLVARSVISARNAAALESTVAAARAVGFDAVSFLPVDVTSTAFGGDPSARAALRLNANDLLALRQGTVRLGLAGDLGGFVAEDEHKMMAMIEGFEAPAGERRAPACNAPEWSSVVEADGALRPCFFQPAVAAVTGGSLRAARESAQYAAALAGLSERNRTCASCVCPKYRESAAREMRGRLGRALARALPMRNQSLQGAVE